MLGSEVSGRVHEGGRFRVGAGSGGLRMLVLGLLEGSMRVADLGGQDGVEEPGFKVYLAMVQGSVEGSKGGRFIGRQERPYSSGPCRNLPYSATVARTAVAHAVIELAIFILPVPHVRVADAYTRYLAMC